MRVRKEAGSHPASGNKEPSGNKEQQAYIIRRPDISRGEPIIQGTRVSVRHIMERVQAGQSVPDILQALSHLTPAQVYSALAYYYDHQSEIDSLLEESGVDQVMSDQGLQLEQVAPGIAVAHDKEGRW